MLTKCKGIDRNKNSCRNYCLENNDYCKIHDYMNVYTKDMLKKLISCSGCQKMYFLNGAQTCERCKKRSTKNRKIADAEKGKCKKESCKFKKSDDNSYCGKHQIYYFKEETEKKNKKVCYNFIRGCREQLDNFYSYSKCSKCLEQERVYDKKYRNKINNENIIK